LVNANPDVVRDSPKKVMDFIKDHSLRRFYMVELEKLLENYAPGRPEMKPDVIAQTIQLEKERAKMAEDAAAAAANGGGGGGGQIILQQPGQQPVALNNEQVVQIIQQLQRDVDDRNKEVAQMKEEYRVLQSKYDLLLQTQSQPANRSSMNSTTDANQNEIIYM
jgi:flagellar motility protein MotE (MotC chaperone)